MGEDEGLVSSAPRLGPSSHVSLTVPAAEATKRLQGSRARPNVGTTASSLQQLMWPVWQGSGSSGKRLL